VRTIAGTSKRSSHEEATNRRKEEVLAATDRLVCERCERPISGYTAENDYVCDEHGFVNAIRVRDGAVFQSHGNCGAPRILRIDERYRPERRLLSLERKIADMDKRGMDGSPEY
jgi:hypothetical protein